MRAVARTLLVYWHLLSLDAPTVATLWVWFLARCNGVALPSSSLAAMAVAVWTLYAADRLLDVRQADEGQLEERHYFHQRHTQGFLVAIVIASLALASLLPHLPPEAIRLYLVLGGLVFGYFVVIHATRSAHRLPKESAVGCCFAAAVFIPTISRATALRTPLLPAALLFAAVCSLNCLMIYAWEHEGSAKQSPHAMTAAALRHLYLLGGIVCSVSVTMAILDRRVPWPIYTSIAASSACLLALHAQHRRHRVLTMRAAADLVLLTPVLVAGLR